MIKAKYEVEVKLTTKGKLYLVELVVALEELYAKNASDRARLYFNVGQGTVTATWEDTLDTLN